MAVIWIGSGRFGVLDPDAAAYIAAVEAADTQALEPAVRAAINDFVVGCKADGIWAAIKASCILAGARTLTGALVPLAGAAPTNVDGLFVAGDYNRKTGLVGDGSTKYLNSNRNNNADPQNNTHLSVYVSTGSNDSAYIGAFDSSTIFGTQLINLSGNGFVRVNSSSALVVSNYSTATGLIAAARSNSTQIVTRIAGVSTTASNASGSPLTIPMHVFRRNNPNSEHTSARLAFYSIGESLDLALLDARVTALINAFAAAIP
jgi:hypothetical protein